MTQELKDFLTFYLPNENLQPFLECFHELHIKKGKHLLKPKQDCNYLAFIQQGSFRVYYYDINGKEIITWYFITSKLFGGLVQSVERFISQNKES